MAEVTPDEGAVRREPTKAEEAKAGSGRGREARDLRDTRETRTSGIAPLHGDGAEGRLTGSPRGTGRQADGPGAGGRAVGAGTGGAKPGIPQAPSPQRESLRTGTPQDQAPQPQSLHTGIPQPDRPQSDRSQSDRPGSDRLRPDGAHSGGARSQNAGATPHEAPLLPHDECDKLSVRLQHAVAGFVDEPRAAVEEADHVLEEVAARFADAVARQRRTLRTSWSAAGESGSGGHPAADTEQLRLTLRDYREMTERLLHV
ncbi:hypothetical protein AB0D78_40380 [Streptomyces avermitilis]|uniref:hypothetical protein n=1 Tax=Streptomyces avermitilis TaxID=33903 RepID=UPI0033F524FA